MKTKKILALALAAVLLMAMTVAGTMAWLQDSTGEIENTFTASTINIDIDETEDTDNDNKASFKMVPGADIAKEPFAIVEGGSEELWLFVTIVEAGNITVDGTTYTFDDYLTYAIDDAWTIVSGKQTDANDTIVIGQKVSASADNQNKNILKEKKVEVLDSVTKAMMDALTTSNYPTLTFSASAIQAANINATTAAEAWAVLNPTSGN